MEKKKQIRLTTNINWKFVIQNGSIIILFLYLVFFGGKGYSITHSFVITTGNCILFTSLFLIILIYCFVTGKKVTEPGFTIYYLLFLGAAGLSVALSFDFWQSVNEYYLWGLYYILFFGFINIQMFGWNRLQILENLLFVGGVYNLIKISQAAIWGYRWIMYDKKGYAALLNYRTSSPNLTAALANLIFMVSLAYLTTTQSKKKRLFYGSLALTSIMAVSLTSSRGGVAAMLAGCGLIIFLLTIRHKDQIKEYWERYKRIAYVLGLVILIFSGGFFVSVFDSSRTGLGGRFAYWSVAFNVFWENPVTGSGLYTFGNQLNSFLSIPPDYIHSHSHNIFLNILAELGLVGFVFFVILLIKISANLYSRYQRENDYAALGALGGLGSFVTHGLVDTLYVEPYLSMTLICILGLALAPVRKSGFVQKLVLHSKSAWFAIIVLGLGWFLNYQRIPLENAIAAFTNNKEQALEYFGEFINRKPRHALAYQQRGITASILAGEKYNHPELIDLAIEDFEEAILYDPTWAVNYANLGVLHASRGNYDQALELLDRAVSLAPRSRMILLNKAIVAEKIGVFDLAEAGYWEFLNLDGNWDLGPFWHQTPLRRKIYLDVQEIILTDTGDEKRPEDYISASSGNIFGKDHLYLAEYYYELGNFEQAQREANLAELSILSSKVQVLDLLWIKAKLAVEAGNTAEGLKLGQSAINGWLYQSAEGPGTYGQSRYGERLYRSPTLESDLVPQFVLMPIPAQWLEHMVEVGKWYMEINSITEAKNILEEVIRQDSEHQEATKLLSDLYAMDMINE